MKTLFICLVLLVSCSKSESKSSINYELMIKGESFIKRPGYLVPIDFKKENERLVALQKTAPLAPSMPETSLNSLSLLGVDSNKDGLRDDVENFINRTYSNFNEREAMKQIGRAFQSFLIGLEKQDMELVFSTQREKYPHALACMEHVSAYIPTLKINAVLENISVLRSWTFKTTPAREELFAKLVQILPDYNAQITSSSDKYCSFKVEPSSNTRRKEVGISDKDFELANLLWDEFGSAHRQWQDVNIPRERKILAFKQKLPFSTKSFDGFVEPPMPSPEENDKTLEGMDSNKDGIRDDVEIWINRTFSNADKRQAMKQLARASQKIMVASFWDQDKLWEELKTSELDKAEGCISYVWRENSLNGIDQLSKLETWTWASSPIRLEAYQKYIKRVVIGGGSAGIESCNFFKR